MQTSVLTCVAISDNSITPESRAASLDACRQKCASVLSVRWARGRRGGGMAGWRDGEMARWRDGELTS